MATKVRGLDVLLPLTGRAFWRSLSGVLCLALFVWRSLPGVVCLAFSAWRYVSGRQTHNARTLALCRRRGPGCGVPRARTEETEEM